MDTRKLLESLTVIHASNRDLQDIVELEMAIFQKTDQFARSNFRYLLSSPNAATFICYHRGAPIGYGMALKNRLRGGRIKGRIYSLGVLPEWRRKGIGELLLAKLEEWLLEFRASFITLETRYPGSSWVFFKINGYSITEKLPGCYVGADGVRMRKTCDLQTGRDRSKVGYSKREKLANGKRK